MIIIDRSPYETAIYYSGNYTVDNIDYKFSLRVGNITRISWDDEAPKNRKKIELDIIKNFEARKEV